MQLSLRVKANGICQLADPLVFNYRIQHREPDTVVPGLIKKGRVDTNYED